MSAGGGTTTITQAVTNPTGVTAHPLTIVWRFPHAAIPAAPLPRAGQPEIGIGRDPSCEVQLTGPDVSRRHALLRPSPGEATAIVDLGSRNGVRVNGRPSAVAPLGPQDVLRLGSWIGVVTTTPGGSPDLGYRVIRNPSGPELLRWAREHGHLP